MSGCDTQRSEWVCRWVAVAAWVVGLAGRLGGAEREAVAPRYAGAWPMQEWSTEELGILGGSFSVTQAAQSRLIYVGSRQGVLEYDGVRWSRPLPTPPGTTATARGLVVDDRGCVWAGFDNVIVRYTADARGHWRMESMLDRLPVEERRPGTVWTIHARGETVWASAGMRIFRFERKGEAIRSWPVENVAVFVGFVDEMPWFWRAGKLWRVREDAFEAAPVAELPAGTGRLFGVVRTVAGALQAEHGRGIIELRENAWVEVAPDVAEWLAGTEAVGAVARLPDGGRILSCNAGPLLFLDADGRVKGKAGEGQGLNERGIHRVELDHDGGLWLASAGAMVRMQIDGAMTRYGRAQGLRGGPRDLTLGADGELWAATSMGWFFREPRTGRFEERGAFEDLFSAGRGPDGWWILAGSGQPLRHWTERGTQPLLAGAQPAFVSLAIDPHDGTRIFGGTQNAVHVLRREPAGWRREAILPGITATIYTLAMDAAGNLWAGDVAAQGMWRFEAPEGDWTRARGERLDGRSGVRTQGGAWLVTIVEGEAVIYSRGGIFRLDATSGKVVRDERFAGLPAGAATPTWRVRAGAKRGVVYVAGEDSYSGRYWRGTRVDGSAAWTLVELPCAEGAGKIELADMCESADGKTLWLGGRNTVALDLTATEPKAFPVPAARWRAVRGLNDGETFYGGAAPLAELALTAGRRELRVDYAAPSYRATIEGRTRVEYRTRVSGLVEEWSSWSTAGMRELTNLPAGRLVLEVQARNHQNAMGPVATLALVVPPFWWETWWFRALLVFAGVALVAVVVRAVVRRQFKQRIALLEAQAAVQQERLRIARDMHDDLGSTLASIVHLSDGGARPGATGDAALARIHEASRDLVHRTRDIVWAATPQHDSLESLIEHLAGHAERTLGDRGVAVRAELPERVPDEAIGAAARQGLFLAFKEAVNNAAKYARANHAVVRVELTEATVVVMLKDDGVGFAAGEVKGTGNGLTNLRERLAALGGSASIDSAPGEGTIVTLRLPRGSAMRTDAAKTTPAARPADGA